MYPPWGQHKPVGEQRGGVDSQQRAREIGVVAAAHQRSGRRGFETHFQRPDAHAEFLRGDYLITGGVLL